METWGIIGWRRMVWWLSGTKMWFPSAQIRWGGGVHVGWWCLPSFWHQSWGVSIVVQPSARTISGWKNSKKTKSYKIFYNQPGAHEQACLSRCFLLWLKSCCIKKISAFNVISRPFLWLWEIWVRDYMWIHFSLTIDFVKFLLNFWIFWRSESLHTRLSYE